MSRFKDFCLLIILGTLLLCVNIKATPTTLNNSSEIEIKAYVGSNATNSNAYNCPKHCTCVMPTNANMKFLHVKCTIVDNLLDDSALQPVYPIHSIDLSYLRLSRVTQIFDKLPNLTSINLSHNELHDVGHLGRRIKRLNLKHNRITSNKLNKLPENLHTLNLQHNDISYLPLDFKRLAHLTNLELSHNDINCSCETLEVRNWIQEHHIFMENPVICAYPAAIKGQSWLQVKQLDICESEKSGWHMEDDENVLMAADQPFEVAENDTIDELKDEFLPVLPQNSTVTDNPSHKEQMSDTEGSGDLAYPNMEHKTVIDEEDYDGSGSGDDEIIIVPHVQKVTSHIEYIPGKVQAGHVDKDVDTQPIPAPFPESESPIEKLNIFDPTDHEQQTEMPVVEQEQYIEEVVKDGGDVPSAESESIQHANMGPGNENEHDNNATYLLLAIIGFLVVGLLLYVGIKRCKNKQSGYDAEAVRQTELLDMDKTALGKPLQRNGTDHMPLIGENTKIVQAKPINGSSKKLYDTNDVKDGAGQPMLNEKGKQKTTHEVNEADTLVPPTEANAHEYHPITPRYPTPKSPRASKYAQYPPSSENNNNTIHNDAYLPSSPKSGRYSPVYSPETGRVKIKLTETPKPKTPMLVTRSRSNAGDFISTPIQPATNSNGHGMH